MDENNIITNLTEKEIATLKAVDALGSSPVSQIAKKAGLARTTVYNFIDKLVDTGLIAMNEIDGIRLYYNPNTSLSLLEVGSTGLANKYHSIKLATNKETIRKSLTQTASKKRAEIKLFVNDKVVTETIGKKFFEAFLAKASATSDSVRVIYTSQNNMKSILDRSALMKRGNLQLAHSPLSLENIILIFNDSINFISAEQGGISYIINNKSLAASFSLLFNNLWPNEEVND